MSPPIVGNSTRTRHVLHLIDKVGPGPWPVLILGETGTGKELVARSMHHARPRGPFVTIDCSSLVGPLIESELFGHTRGAFTGAIGSKTGLIEAANGGTAFLDEIGELPLDFQSKLLRVLQEKEFRPVGSLQPRRSDFRIIAATNRDLAKEVERGTFRRDLYYRLNVVTIRLAPLREREEDLPALIDHFLARYGAGHVLTQEARDAIMAYDWPGNVREVENCIQHMVALHSGPLLTAGDFPSALANFVYARREHALCAAAGVDSPAAQARAFPVGNGVLPLMEMERRAILQALDFTHGDRSVAAHLLG
ncbi:MAG: sigma-54 interaction domain-containing protein, partial [Bryobacteraceae bacterium]